MITPTKSPIVLWTRIAGWPSRGLEVFPRWGGREPGPVGFLTCLALEYSELICHFQIWPAFSIILNHIQSTHTNSMPPVCQALGSTGEPKLGEASWRKKGLTTPEVMKESRHVRIVPMVNYQMGCMAKTIGCRRKEKREGLSGNVLEGWI